MAKWGFLARAYAIGDYAYMKQCESEMNEVIDESIDAVANDIKIILEMAEDNFITVTETPNEYRTIRQCKKWLSDFYKSNMEV